MVREFISDLVLIIFFIKLMVQPLWTHLGVVKSSPISIFHGQNDIKPELWHLQAQSKCLYLCFHDHWIPLWCCFDDISTLIHCIALRDPFRGSRTISDIITLLAKQHKTLTMAPPRSLKMSEPMIFWSKNLFLNLFW